MVEMRDNGTVRVSRWTRYGDGDDHWRNRLREGLQHNIALSSPKLCSVSAATRRTIASWLATPCCSVSVTGGAVQCAGPVTEDGYALAFSSSRVPAQTQWSV